MTVERLGRKLLVSGCFLAAIFAALWWMRRPTVDLKVSTNVRINDRPGCGLLFKVPAVLQVGDTAYFRTPCSIVRAHVETNQGDVRQEFR